MTWLPNGQVIEGEQAGCFTINRYKFVYVTTAEVNGFFGAHVCNPTVVMFPDTDKIVGFKDMYDAIVYLRAVRK